MSAKARAKLEDHREASRAAGKRLEAEFPEFFSEAFDVCIPAGWHDLVREYCARIVAVDPHARAHQLKEKFAGVRLYLDGSGEVYPLVDELESKSLKVCQWCGSTDGARMRGRSWLRTLCDGCGEE